MIKDIEEFAEELVREFQPRALLEDEPLSSIHSREQLNDWHCTLFHKVTELKNLAARIDLAIENMREVGRIFEYFLFSAIYPIELGAEMRGRIFSAAFRLRDIVKEGGEC